MEDLLPLADQVLAHWAVQAAMAPFLAGLVIALLFYPVRLSGLAVAGGFVVALYLTGNLRFEPLDDTRKLLLVALAAPLLGALADLAFRPARGTGVVLGVIFGLASFWVFLNILGKMPPQRLVLYALGIAALVAVTVGFCMASLNEPVRAGAAGLGLGLGVGTGALLGGAKLFGLLGIALGAASGGFLLLAMILGKRLTAGTSLALSTGVIASLLAAGAVLQGRLPWYYAAGFALVPLAVRLPLPERSHPFVQAIVALIYSLTVAGGVCFLIWRVT